jgi:hypothetical protein
MGNITEIFNEFKTKVEKEQFVKQQHDTITALMTKNAQLEQEVAHLKKMLVESVPLLPQENPVSKIILTPEEAVIESQIQIIQDRSYGQELTLEDVKKLDLLIKNKRLVKEQSTTIQGESKKVDKKQLSHAELILIASKGPSDGNS